MPHFRIRLIEELTLADDGDFDVDAPSPSAAARILRVALDDARLDGSNMLCLPDGQQCLIEPKRQIESRIRCVLLDEHGAELQEIDPAAASAHHGAPDETS